MDFSEGPAALGGIMMCVALGAWALGRWQGGLVEDQRRTVNSGASEAGRILFDQASTPSGLPAPVTQARDIPSLDAARAERGLALGGVGPLAQLHAEITAYRHAEQVLVGLDSNLLQPSGIVQGTASDCRYLGIVGEPTCGMIAGTHQDCDCSIHARMALSAIQVPQPVQPSASVAGLTRV